MLDIGTDGKSHQQPSHMLWTLKVTILQLIKYLLKQQLIKIAHLTYETIIATTQSAVTEQCEKSGIHDIAIIII